MTAYKEAKVPYGTKCVSQARTCSNGKLSGTYIQASCSVNPPRQFSHWAVVRNIKTDQIRNVNIQSGSSYTTVFLLAITLKKDDFVTLQGENQLSEKDSKRTTIYATITANGDRIAPIAFQEASRGYGQNHHMPLSVATHFVAPQDGTYSFRFEARSNVKTKVIVDGPAMGALNATVYRKFATIEERESAKEAWGIKDLLYRGPGTGTTNLAVNSTEHYTLKTMALSTSQSDDFIAVSSQLMTQWRKNPVAAEMVVSNISYFNQANNSRLQQYRSGENVTRQLYYHTINLNPVIPIRKGSSRIDMIAYGGNKSGFIYHKAMNYLQGLYFSKESAKYFMTDHDRKILSSNSSMALGSDIPLLASKQFNAKKSALIAASVNIQLSGSGAGNCYLRMALFEKSSAGAWTAKSYSPYNIRNIGQHHTHANLKQTFTFEVSAGSYQVRPLVKCTNASNLSVTRYASGSAAQFQLFDQY